MNKWGWCKRTIKRGTCVGLYLIHSIKSPYQKMKEERLDRLRLHVAVGLFKRDFCLSNCDEREFYDGLDSFRKMLVDRFIEDYETLREMNEKE